MTPVATSRAVGPTSGLDGATLVRAHGITVEKARRNIVRLADRPISAAWAADGNYFGFAEGFFEIGNWTSSFFTGMALLAFGATGESELLTQVNRLAGVYREKVTTRRRDTMHDLGFLYTLSSIALYRLTGDREHRRTGLLAADELAKRFRPHGAYLQAWGRMDETGGDYAGLAIIDCLMNLPLLFWAAREAGKAEYRDIAIAHANTTLAHFVRADGSVCHAFRFDLASGAPVGPDNYCGYAVDSQWARGTAWAIYGFALAYRHTGDARYLEASTRLAQGFVAQLDAELVPVWDFRLPAGAATLRDSSAAAIAVCGLDELTAQRPNGELARAAEALLGRLCDDAYLDPNPECPGVLRNAEVGAGAGELPGTLKARNVYASWGDYFFLEALSRRRQGATGWWGA